jgi:uncharacterized membrane protein
MRSSLLTTAFALPIIAALTPHQASADPAYTFSTFSVPGASYTYAHGINDAGQVVGYYGDATSLHNFVDTSGSFSTVNVPDATASGINATGQVVGTYSDGTRLYGFVDTAGTYSSIAVPGAFYTNTVGINDAGQVVGTYGNATVSHGFVDTAGIVDNIDVPGAIYTSPFGINDAGTVVGGYADPTNCTDPTTCVPHGDHGFVYTAGIFDTIDVPGAYYTDVYGINDAGQIVGSYGDATGDYGFVATPNATTVPEPGSLVMLGAGLLRLCTISWRRRRT